MTIPRQFLLSDSPPTSSCTPAHAGTITRIETILRRHLIGVRDIRSFSWIEMSRFCTRGTKKYQKNHQNCFNPLKGRRVIWLQFAIQF